MAIRKIREMGEKVLTQAAKPVTEMNGRTKTLIEDMLTDALIDGRIKSGDDILVYAENGKIRFVKTR